MYRKVEKTFVNPYGIEEVSDDKNPFIEPCVLGIMPSRQLQEMNGYLSEFVDFLGLKHKSNLNSGYGLSEVPFSVLIDSKTSKIANQILSLIPENDINSAKKLLRNLNIISYCSGHNETLLLINSLYDGLINKGYKKEEVEEMLSQIFVVQIVDNLTNDNDEYQRFPYVTSLTFHNYHDLENLGWQLYEPDILFTSTFSRIGHLPNSSINSTILYNSFGEGSLGQVGGDHVFKNDYFLAPVLNTLISICLINGIHSSLSNEPISLEFVMRHFDFILAEAAEYEKGSKPLDELTKEELMEFNTHMKKFVIEYIQKLFKLNAKNNRTIDDERREIIQGFIKSDKYSFLKKMKTINDYIAEIIDYYQKYDKNDAIMVPVGNCIELPYTIEQIIKKKFHILLNELREVVLGLKKLTLDKDVSPLLQNELAKAKTTILKSIFNPVILEIMKEYDILFLEDSISVDDDIKKGL